MRENGAYKQSEVDALIKEYVPAAYTKSENGDTLIYLLPDESKPNFCELLKRIESDQTFLGISYISVSVTTLEDVFLKAGEAAKESKTKTLEHRISMTKCK